jgi:hypothetical protein
MVVPKVQILRTATPNQPPQALAPGEFAIEMASTPPRLWIGVDTTIDPVGMKMLLPIGAVIVDDLAPIAPINGALWWESDTGIMWMWYNDGDTAQWVQVNGLGAGGGASVTTDPEPPSNPKDGDLWWESDAGMMWVYFDDGDSQQWVQVGGPGLQGPPGPAGVAGPAGPAGPVGPAGPAAPTGVSIACSFVGKPAVSAAVFIPITMPLSIPANLEGSVGYARTVATANAVFSVSKISFGVAVELGTITAVAGLQTGFIFSGIGGLLVAGDVLQFFGPATQDATLADVGISIHTTALAEASIRG